MKKNLLLAFAILTLSIKAQSDTIIVNGVAETGTVTAVKLGILQLQIGNETFSYPVHKVSRIAISTENPNKRQVETSYLFFLYQPDQSGAYNTGYNYNQIFNAGYYMRRGANRQIGGIIFAAGSLLVGSALIASSKSSTGGLIVIGAGDFVGFILNLCGIADFKTAGEILDREKR